MEVRNRKTILIMLGVALVAALGYLVIRRLTAPEPLVLDAPEATDQASAIVTGTGPADRLVRITGGVLPITTSTDLDGRLEVEVALAGGVPNQLEFQVVGGAETLTSRPRTSLP